MKQFLLITLLLPNLLFGQLTATLDTNNILIGDQVTLTLKGVATETGNWPVFTDSIGQLELLSSSAIDSQQTAEGWLLQQAFILTQWDSGFYHIPSIFFGNFNSQELIVTVNTVEIGEAAKDIKGPIAAPITLKEIAAEITPYLLALIILGLIILLVLRYLKNKPEQTQSIHMPSTPPYEIALEALEQLKIRKQWQAGDVKGFYTGLSEILRTYIEEGLQTPAMEMLTADIISGLTAKEIDTNNLATLLQTADMAKFAKAQPLAAENEQHMHYSFEFIHQTKPQGDVE